LEKIKSSKHACERVGKAYLVTLLMLFMSSSESSTLKGGQVTQTSNTFSLREIQGMVD